MFHVTLNVRRRISVRNASSHAKTTRYCKFSSEFRRPVPPASAGSSRHRRRRQRSEGRIEASQCACNSLGTIVAIAMSQASAASGQREAVRRKDAPRPGPLQCCKTFSQLHKVPPCRIKRKRPVPLAMRPPTKLYLEAAGRRSQAKLHSGACPFTAPAGYFDDSSPSASARSLVTVFPIAAGAAAWMQLWTRATHPPCPPPPRPPPPLDLPMRLGIMY